MKYMAENNNMDPQAKKPIARERIISVEAVKKMADFYRKTKVQTWAICIDNDEMHVNFRITFYNSYIVCAVQINNIHVHLNLTSCGCMLAVWN